MEAPPPQPAQEPIRPSEEPPRKKKRLLSEKQLEALKRGREKRWSLAEELNASAYPEEPPIKQPEPSHPFLDPNTSSSSSEESSEEEPTYPSFARSLPPPPLAPTKKKIPKAVRKRIDRYVKKKLEESFMTPSSAYMSSTHPYPYSNQYSRSSSPLDMLPPPPPSLSYL